MASKYQEQHYEDVARIMREVAPTWHGANIPEIAEAWADLFAADNPPTCYVDGDHDGECDDGCLLDAADRARLKANGVAVVHGTPGFDRERFLKACGLEAE